MINRQKKISPQELARARSSSFVVDLRQQKLPKKEVEKRKKSDSFFGLKKISKLRSPFFNKINKRKKKSFNFNLLSHSLPFDFFKTKINFWLKDLKFYRTKKKGNNLWQQVVKDKRRILNSRFFSTKRRLKRVEHKLTWYRSVFFFALVLLFLVVPLKILSYFQFLNLDNLESKIMFRSQAAISQLALAVDSVSQFDFQSADRNFSLASQEFLRAEEDLAAINDSLFFLASLSNNPKLKLASESKNILAAGTLSSSLGKNLVLATNSLFNYQAESDFLSSLQNFFYYGYLARQDALDLQEAISKINKNNLPLEYQDKFSDLKDKAKFLNINLDSFISLSDKIYEILGQSQDKRYLLVFQNNAELRASGGFLGSYALIDIREGRIRNVEVPAGGSYDTEGGMTVKVKAPEPLWLVNPLWHFWDANWWPDWPKTAENLMWFYEKSGGSTVDGVITFTPTVVENLLEITGPIDMDQEYGLVIDSNNFWETVQKIVEHDNLIMTHPEETIDFKEMKGIIESDVPLYQDLENNPENKPKKIVGDLMVRILEILPQRLDKDNLVKIIKLFESSLAQKQIMFYFSDSKLQQEMVKKNLAGEVKPSTHDYLLVVNTNIAGQKTDRKITENIEHLSQIDNTGKIINNIKIERTHLGIKNEALTGVRNVNWLRVYVPLGSRLISASGFSAPDSSYFEEPEDDWLESKFLQEERLAKEDPISGIKIYQEHGKTVFAGWVMVDPGEIANISISYELPFNFFSDQEKGDNNFWQRLNKLINPDFENFIPYSLLLQKQPGAAPSSFISRLILPDNLEIIWKHPDNLFWQNGWLIESSVDMDKYFSILLKNKYETR
jgi:hypothetical protein